MTKEFIPHEEALALKELGFNEPCFARYSDMTLPKKMGSFLSRTDWDTVHVNLIELESISAPLYQQAFRWFREKHELYPDFFVDDDKTFGFMISYFIPAGRADKPIQRLYKTYEEAELECIKQLIKIVKEKK